MKDCKVGNTVYVKGTMKPVDDVSLPYCVDFGNGNTGWIPGDDIIDERMLRVPNDLNDTKIREEYFSNHINWFLHNHGSSTEKFITTFISKYHQKIGEAEYRYINKVAESHGVSNNKIGLMGEQISHS